MHLKKDEFAKLKPVKFPTDKGAARVVSLETKKGKSTREVITEMKRLSKKDIFPPRQHVRD